VATPWALPPSAAAAVCPWHAPLKCFNKEAAVSEKVNDQEIIDRCKKELAPFKVPKKIVLMEALPKTPTGKILKRDMRASNKDLFIQKM
jgi:acyl-coenzyme A synthetase/AMP-(fatty) acid ligase